MKTGYCTNIHQGASVGQVIDNLLQYAVPIRQATWPSAPMGIGLWFSRQAVSQALNNDRWKEVASVLAEHDLVPHTFNAFPYSDFHQAVIKHDVYRPSWSQPQRLDYTTEVARLQHWILEPGKSATISTVPLGWPDELAGERQMADAVANLKSCAHTLHKMAEEFGRETVLAIEPEPGCQVATSLDLCRFFTEHLFNGPDAELIRRHIGVCHDICHAAVMFEPQAEALDRYRAAGILIAKVQISSALQLDLPRGSDLREIREYLQAFAEPRYLHQSVFAFDNGTSRFFDDLPPAMSYLPTLNRDTVLRIHFHVPIHLAEINDRIKTTQPEIDECLVWLTTQTGLTRWPHLEVETYAWGVAPESARGGSLIDSVVAELKWVDQQLRRIGGPGT